MYILSADTAAKTASVCVSEVKDGTLYPISHAAVNGTLTHSESLLPMIDFCLKGADLTFADIGAAVISNGPGSFTGVRIGVATFKGLGFADQNKPFIGVSTLEALAYNLAAYPARTLIFPVMDARRMQFYNAAFTVNGGKIRRLCADRLETFDELYADLKEKYAGRKIRLVGDGAALFFAKCAENDDGLDIAMCDAKDIYEDAFSVARCALPEISALTDGTPNPYPSEKLGVVSLRASQAERERNKKEQANA